MSEWLKRNKKIWIPVLAVIVCAVIALTLVLILNNGYAGAKSAILTVETPQKVSRNTTESIIIDVTVSSLGEALYPAASMSISFDSARLEFMGIREGNVFVNSDGEKGKIALPEWSYNVDACNESGCINVMYLDMTGGENAFSNDLLAKEDNVVLRLEFRLRGSVRSGDICDLIIEDAVFAASDETLSLATSKGTLKAKNGKIVIGE